ncbi:MAG: hypothetical protein WBP03_04465 [Candidatus Saccharimonadales bacterium]|jgi:hypothetical protein
MEITPKQLHNFAGFALGLAAETHSVRSYPKTQKAHTWFMMFPSVSGMEEAQNGECVEVSRSISMRVGRIGYKVWSLWIDDRQSILRTFDGSQVPLFGRDEDGLTPNYDISNAVAQGVVRSIMSFRWGRTIVSSKKTHQVLVPEERRQPIGMDADYFERIFTTYPDPLILAELDLAAPHFGDLGTIRQDLLQHVQAHKDSSMSRR